MGVFRKLTLRHWSWIHFKFAMLVWAVVLLGYTPTAVAGALGAVVITISTVTIVGSVTSIVGIVMSAQNGTKAGVIGISVELAGLYFMGAGPVAYFITQVWLALTLPEGSQRYALVVFSYAMCVALACRILIVAPRRNREAHDLTKGV